jgi:hypothetical protein
MDRTSPTLTTLSSDALIDLAVQTRSVLRSLKSDLLISERERHARGKADPVRDLTGASALQRAVRDTESMLARVEAVLTDRVAAEHAGRSSAGDAAPRMTEPLLDISTSPFCGVPR